MGVVSIWGGRRRGSRVHPAGQENRDKELKILYRYVEALKARARNINTTQRKKHDYSIKCMA